ncbi:guanylate kinase [Francisellaceae bacterium]|nr:guanylate kinase [Francisellaceae bacterium]
MDQSRKGLIYVISAPSGAGKTSLVNQLLNILKWVGVCTSHTTRKPRVGELDGVEYHFTTNEKFEDLIKNEALIEYANVFGNYYGTAKSEIDNLIESGKDVILEIDWQGARQVKALYPKRTVSIFILPPSLQSLEERLRKRNKDPDDVIANRMAKAKDEISHCHEYKYMIVNIDFDEALADIVSIFRIERLKAIQLSQVNTLVSELLK